MGLSTFAITLLIARSLSCALAKDAPPSDASIFATRPPDARAIDVSTFGAVGDGVTDDTLALQRALNATYAPGSVDCTVPGARTLYLEGNGKKYLLSSSVKLWTWVRLIGWGGTRPTLILNPSTAGFGSSSSLVPLIRVIDGTPDSTKPCTSNALDGGNTAFGVGVMNVDIAIAAGNPGAVGLRWRAAQGGILRAMRFDLAADAAACVHSPGWAHEDLHFVGGRAGVLVYDTGAWPSIFRDSIWEGQGVAGISWDGVSSDANHESPWEGITVVRGTFSSAPAAANASGVCTTRFSLLDCVFKDLGAVVDPPSFLGNSSVLIRNSGGVRVPTLLGASDVSGVIVSPGGTTGAFVIQELVAGAQTDEVRAPGGGAVHTRVRVDAAPAASAPPLPPRDTFFFPPMSSWVSVIDHGVTGDGHTDNAVALNALFAAVTPGAALYFPTGVYVVGATLILDKPLSLFGLSCWDVVLTLPDGASGFADPTHLTPILHVTAVDTTWVVGMNVRSGFTFGAPAPPPAPNGTFSPNPGALALLWETPFGGVHDVFFHPATFPDNPRVMPSPQTELSLVIVGSGGGTFADIWTCNAYSLGGVRVDSTRAPVTFYQLSTEHHAGSELHISNASVVVHTMQTEDRSPDAAPTASVILDTGGILDLTGLYSYYAANVPSDAAVIVRPSSKARLAVFRQYHSYHPIFFQSSILALEEGGLASRVNATDFAFAGVSWVAAPSAAAPAAPSLYPQMAAFSAAFISAEVSYFQTRELGTTSIRDMSAAAWALLSSSHPNAPSSSNLSTAVGMFELVLSRQLPSGQWPWTWSSSVCADTNAVQFTALPMARALLAYGHLFPPGWLDAHAHSLVLAAEASWAEGSTPGSEAQPHYTNIATMRIGVLTLIAQLTSNATIAARASDALKTWASLVVATNIHEYSSPTYTAVTLHNLIATAADVEDANTAATLRRYADFFWITVAAAYWAPAAEMAGAHSRDYDTLFGQAGMDWAYALSGIATAGGVPGDGDAFTLNFDPITQTELFVTKMRGDMWPPPAAALALAQAPMGDAWRVVRSSFSSTPAADGPSSLASPLDGSDTYLFASSVATLGSSSLYYGNQDKQIVAQLAVSPRGVHPAASPRLVQVTVVQDVWDEPFGRNRGGACGKDVGKPTHAKATVASVQDCGLLLSIQDLTMTLEGSSHCGPFTSIATNIVFPAGKGVDGIYHDGVLVTNVSAGAPSIPLALGATIAVRSAGGIVGFRIPFVDGLNGFVPQSWLKFDGPRFSDAARLVTYLYQGRNTTFPNDPQPSRSIIAMGVGSAASDADAAAFSSAFASLHVTNDVSDDTNWRVSIAGDTTSSPYPGFASTLSAALYVPREKRILARHVNGTAAPMPRMGFLEVSHSDGRNEAFTP